MVMDTQLVPLTALARRLHVTSRWLRAEAEAGRIPSVRADKRFLFDQQAVESVLLERARRKPEGEGVHA